MGARASAFMKNCPGAPQGGSAVPLRCQQHGVSQLLLGPVNFRCHPFLLFSCSLCMMFCVLWLDCISLMTDDLSTFSCACWIFIDLLLSTVYSSISPIFYWVFVFWLWMYSFHIAQTHVLRLVDEL